MPTYLKKYSENKGAASMAPCTDFVLKLCGEEK